MGLPFTGLASLDVSTEELTIYSHDDSDPDTVSSDFGYAVLEDQQGRLWYGTHNGLNIFDQEAQKLPTASYGVLGAKYYESGPHDYNGGFYYVKLSYMF